MKCPNCDTLAADSDRACVRCRTPLNGPSDPGADARIGQVVLAAGVCIGGMLAKGVEFKAVLPFIACTVVVVVLFGPGGFRKPK
jgi:hypothetical protein